LVAAAGALSGSATAQVISVGYGTGAVGVPLSPWAAAATAVLVAVAAGLFTRRNGRAGFFALALALLGGSLALNTEDSTAAPGGITISGTNPALSPDYGFGTCSGIKTIPVTNGLSARVVITSLQVTPSPPWHIQSFVTGDCQVGGALVAGATCNVRIDDDHTAC
jgi:hypothetical protein